MMVKDTTYKIFVRVSRPLQDHYVLSFSGTEFALGPHRG